MSDDSGSAASIDAIEMLMADHRRVEGLFEQFEGAVGEPAIARRAAEQLIRELSIHAAIEEQILYPAARDAVSGESLVEHSLEEHQRVKELLAEVDGKASDDPEVRQALADLKAAVADHVSEEEAEMFPKLREALGLERLTELADEMARAKKMAPTHPHPNAPNEPPANKIAGPPTALLDRVRDAVRRRS